MMRKFFCVFWGCLGIFLTFMAIMLLVGLKGEGFVKAIGLIFGAVLFGFPGVWLIGLSLEESANLRRIEQEQEQALDAARTRRLQEQEERDAAEARRKREYEEAQERIRRNLTQLVSVTNGAIEELLTFPRGLEQIQSESRSVFDCIVITLISSFKELSIAAQEGVPQPERAAVGNSVRANSIGVRWPSALCGRSVL